MKNPKNFLIWIGNVGASKTHFCACLGEWILRKFDTNRVHKERNLLSRLRSAIAEGFGDYISGLEYLVDDDIVILDDVGEFLKTDYNVDKDWTFNRNVFSAFVDYRYSSMKPTIITSNMSQELIKDFYGDRVWDRLFNPENIVIETFDETSKRQQGM